MTIGERIRDARKAANMNQSELGIKLDIGKSSISEWESGKRPVPIDLVDAIADALNVTVPFLMGWCIEEETKDYSAFSLSPAALALARKYDAMDEHGRKVLDSIADLEFQRLAAPSYADEVERFNQMSAPSIESSAL